MVIYVFLHLVGLGSCLQFDDSYAITRPALLICPLSKHTVSVAGCEEMSPELAHYSRSVLLLRRIFTFPCRALTGVLYGSSLANMK